jgi:hypothetical protein
MLSNIDTLELGDIVEIKYRTWRNIGAGGEDVVEKWINARVVACEAGAWPLVRLTDGQVTEVRPFMTWRPIHLARRSRNAIAA